MATQLPETVSLGLGPTIKIVRVGVREMRKAAKCERQHVTPKGLWDDDGNRILVLKDLKRRDLLEVYFHELTHAVTDVSWWALHP